MSNLIQSIIMDSPYFTIPDDILNYIPMYFTIFEFDPSKGYSTGRIVRCNKEASDIVGYTEDEMKGMGFSFFEQAIHPEDIKHYNEAINSLLNSEEKEYINFLRVKPKRSNHYISFKCCCRILLPIELHKPLHFICSFFPKKLEEEYADIPNDSIGKNSFIERFSSREKEIADLLIKGRTDKQIAEHLNISHLTVKTHRFNIKKKCNAHSTPELIHFLHSNECLEENHPLA